MNDIIEKQLQTKEGAIELVEATRLLYRCYVYSKEKEYKPSFDHTFAQLLKMVDDGKYGFEQVFMDLDLDRVLSVGNLEEDFHTLERMADISCCRDIIRNMIGYSPSLLQQMILLQDEQKFADIVTRMSDEEMNDRNKLLEIVRYENLSFLSYEEMQRILETQSLSNEVKIALLLNWAHCQNNSDLTSRVRKDYFEKDETLRESLLYYLYDLSGTSIEQIHKNEDLRLVVEQNLVDLNDYSDDSESIFEKYYGRALYIYNQKYSHDRTLFDKTLLAILATGNGIRPGDEKLVIEFLLKSGETKQICYFFAHDQYRHFTLDTIDFLFSQLNSTYYDNRRYQEQRFLNTLVDQWIELEEAPDTNETLLCFMARTTENSPLYESRQKLHNTLQTIAAPLNSVQIGSYYSNPSSENEAKKTYVKRMDLTTPSVQQKERN